jgi:hypothetical protein
MAIAKADLPLAVGPATMSARGRVSIAGGDQKNRR